MRHPHHVPRQVKRTLSHGGKNKTSVAKYNILVPVGDPRNDDGPSPAVHFAVKTRNSLWRLLAMLPLPLKIVLGVCVVNFAWLVGFASPHYFDANKKPLIGTARNSLTESRPDPAETGMNADESFRALLRTTPIPQISTEATIAENLPDNTIKITDEYGGGVGSTVLVVIVSNRLNGIIPTVSSILTSTKIRPVDLVLIGDEKINQKVQEHFAKPSASRANIHQFTSLTVDDIQRDLQKQGYSPIWTWPEWGTSQRDFKHWRNENTLHMADWDDLATHAHELNHLRFYLPLLERFRTHRSLYFLDDDILVQKDLGETADEALKKLPSDKALITPCNIWVWDPTCHRFNFQDEETIKPIWQSPALYGDRRVCESDSEPHCYPLSYDTFVKSVTPKHSKNATTRPKDQKAWNFGFSLFVLDHWRSLDLTAKYEAVMKESYRLHVFPERSLSFGLGASYIAFAGAVECWNDQHIKVRDGFGFVEYSSYERTFGKGFLESSVDVLHYTGPNKPWADNTTIELQSLQPWMNYMAQEGLPIPDQITEQNGENLFTLLATDRSGAEWVMKNLDSHPSICASGEFGKPESGFPSDVLLPYGMPWLSLCSVKRGCSFSFVRDAVQELALTMDLRGRTGRVPTRCRPDYPKANDPFGVHLSRVCNFLQALKGDFKKEGAIEALWVDAFRREDQLLLGCRCARGTTVKGLKVFVDWLTYNNFPYKKLGPPDLVLDKSALKGSKVIRLKRRNPWEQYKSAVIAQKSGIYHIGTAAEKTTQIRTAGNVTIVIEEMLNKMKQMTELDAAGDKWAKMYGSNVLNVYFEDCQEDTPTCFQRIFQYLQVDPSHVNHEMHRFDSIFSGDDIGKNLDNVVNTGPVKEALCVNGYAKYIGLGKNYTELQLLVFDDSEVLEKTHQFHQGKGINVTLFGRSHPERSTRNNMLKYGAAVLRLEEIDPDTLVVLSGSREVRLQYPAENDYLRYEAIYDFRQTFEKLTKDFPGAVVAATESSCCASSLTHAKPGDFFGKDGRRTQRSCLSAQPGCEWAGEEKSWPWQTFMQQLAFERSLTVSENQYLDATLLAGKAKDLLNLILKASIGETEDDDAVLTDFLYRNQKMIVLDYEQQLFGKNREGLHKKTNFGCPFGPSPSITAQRPKKFAPLFMHTPRYLGCTAETNVARMDAFPRWDKNGIQIGHILDHLNLVADKEASIVHPPGHRPDGKSEYFQGPEIPYFVDERGVWTSKLIRDRTDNITLAWRTIPTESLIHIAYKIVKLGGTQDDSRWTTLVDTLKSGGFPYWSWYGDFKYCNYLNSGTASIPILTPCARADCDHAFPVPNYMNIIDSQPSSDNWRGLFRDTKVQYPWETKIRKIVWRGSLTENDPSKVFTSVRWRVGKMLHYLHSDMYDFGLTTVPIFLTRQMTIDVAEVGGLREGIKPMADFQRYMAILDMDGNSWSSRFASLLCYNSVVVKIEPQYVEYFYNDLQPWTHYIPVKNDLSDLNENVAWALDKANEETVQEIINSANDWCAQRMVPEDLAHDLLDTWESYVRLLYRADPGWQKQWMSKKSALLSATSRFDLFRLKDIPR